MSKLTDAIHADPDQDHDRAAECLLRGKPFTHCATPHDTPHDICGAGHDDDKAGADEGTFATVLFEMIFWGTFVLIATSGVGVFYWMLS